MKLDYSKKILIVSIAVFTAILVLAVIFSNLLFGKINSINDKVSQLSASAQEREKALSLKDSIDNSTTDRLKLEKYFIGAGDAETAKFVSDLESAAKASGLTSEIQSISYEAVSGIGSTSAVAFLRIRVNLIGKWSSLFGFLQTIENLPRVIFIQGVSLSASDKAWSANIDFFVAGLKN